MTKKKSKGAQPGPDKFCLITDMTSEEYHSTPGTFSSSQLKDILEDEEIFYKKHIAKTEPRKHISAFDVGTYFHTAILEPHLLNKECAVYKGFRRGDKWESFQKKNEGKAIITSTEEKAIKMLIAIAKDNKILMRRVKNGEPEVSAFVDILVRLDFNGKSRVFCESPHGNRELSIEGWQPTKFKAQDSDVRMTLKARADSLIQEKGEIFDLKTTTGNTKKLPQIRATVRKHNYDLSGALYLDVFSAATDTNFDKFTWGFASKDYMNCCTWRMDEAYVRVGRAKWKKAVTEIARGIVNDWEVVDRVRSIGPGIDELDLLSDF